MIKLSFLLLAVLSFFYGIVFFLTPEWFVSFSIASNINIAWLRSIGASILGILVMGSMYIYLNPVGKLEILRLITITSFLQTLALIYSRLFDEFSAKNIMVIDSTIVVASLVTIYLVLLNVYKKDFFI